MLYIILGPKFKNSPASQAEKKYYGYVLLTGKKNCSISLFTFYINTEVFTKISYSSDKYYAKFVFKPHEVCQTKYHALNFTRKMIVKKVSLTSEFQLTKSHNHFTRRPKSTMAVQFQDYG